MLNSILAAVFLAAGPLQGQTVQDEKPPEIDPKVVAEAVEGLDAAFKKGKTEDRLAAIAKYGSVNDGAVIELISRGLKDKETAIRSASIESLRWLKHPDALDALQESYKKDRAIKKDEGLWQEMIKAIGQHGNPKSIELLLDGALAAVPHQVQVARIYSLGNIRDKASLEGLMEIMQRTGRANRRGGESHPMMAEISNSLFMLTGQDLGKDEKAWVDWWKANEKEFEISAEPVGIPKPLQKKWDRYWGVDKKTNDPEEPKEKLGRGNKGSA
jgi:hypothetical protein